MFTIRIKNYDIGEMSEKWLESKSDFETLTVFDNPEELKAETIAAIKTNGRAYAVFEKKNLVGIYVFEMKEMYFEDKNEYVNVGGKRYDTQKFWYGDNTKALVLSKKYLPQMPNETEKRIDEYISETLGSLVSEGQIAGVAFENKLYFRKNDKNGKNAGTITLGYLGGFALGFVVGYLIFKEWWMGLCFGACYMTLFGGAGMSFARKDASGVLDLDNVTDMKDEE